MSVEETDHNPIEFSDNQSTADTSVINLSSQLGNSDGDNGLMISNNEHESLEKTIVETELIVTQNVQDVHDPVAFNQASADNGELINEENGNENIKAEADGRSSAASFKLSDQEKNEAESEVKNEFLSISIENQSSHPTYSDNSTVEKPSSAGESSKQEFQNENIKPAVDDNSSTVSLKQSALDKNETDFVNEKDNATSSTEEQIRDKFISDQPIVAGGTPHDRDNITTDQPSVSEERSKEESVKEIDNSSNIVSFKQLDLDKNDAEFHREKGRVSVNTEEQTSYPIKSDYSTSDQASATKERTIQDASNENENENIKAATNDSVSIESPKQSDSDKNEDFGVKDKPDIHVETGSPRASDMENSESKQAGVVLITEPVPSKESGSVLNAELESKTGQDKIQDTAITEQILPPIEIPSNTADPRLENPEDQKEDSFKRDTDTGVNNKEQTLIKTTTRSSKAVIQGRAVTKIKSEKERKSSTGRDLTSKNTGRKISTPRISTSKKDESKVSTSKDNKKSPLTRKLGVDHSRERINQTASVKDTNLHKSSVSDKSSTVGNQGSEPSKDRQTSDKDAEKKQEHSKPEKISDNIDAEKKQQLLQSQKNSDAETLSSTRVHDATEDKNVKSNSTCTIINEKERSKTSQKVKWNENVALQLKGLTKPLPNGNISSKQNKQEDLKTESVSENERNLTNNVEKGKPVAVIEEDAETTNEKEKEKFNPRSLLAKAVLKKGGKDKSGSGFVAMNGPTKTQSKASLAVRSVSTVDDKDDKLSVESRRDSTMLSLDSASRKSVDFRNTSTTHHIPEEKPRSILNANNDSWIRSAIPYQPLSLSILCLLLNIFLPGTGTVLSGISILCCGKTRVTSKDDHVTVTVCVNICVGVAQLFTITFCLVGWFWSIAWGIKMVILSVEYRRELKAKREMELQAMALSAFGSPTRVRNLFNTTA
ncbi:protein stum-like [Gigantopelta aegis]|uniref:protein stum-like n=1 Tax=Gigantopelta aegis TaxID=1735272 RepID=UPI001B887C08|nr:protein stum-like [Gigantopelta aegis]